MFVPEARHRGALSNETGNIGLALGWLNFGQAILGAVWGPSHPPWSCSTRMLTTSESNHRGSASLASASVARCESSKPAVAMLPVADRSGAQSRVPRGDRCAETNQSAR
jgi:hypothetical protein